MRTLVGFGFSLLLAAGLLAQHRGGFGSPRPFQQSTFGNAVFPAGATRLGATGGRQGVWRRPSVPGSRRPGTVFVYWYPVFVGGYAADDYPDEPAPPQQQPDTTETDSTQPAPEIVQDPTTPTAAADDLQPVEEPPSTAEPSHYLIAFKDRSIYSAVAYWVDGDTLHYYTSGSTHNQVSVSLVDRDLTERLNEESGLELKLPPIPPIR